MKKPSSIKDVLSGGLAVAGLKGMLREVQIRKLWQDVVGAGLATKCEPHFLKDGVLHVRVLSSVWLTELKFHSELIKDRVNRILGEPLVKTVRFRVGMATQKKESIHKKKPQRELTPEEKAFIEEKTKPIEDPALKEALRKAMEKGFRSGRLKY